MDEQKQKVIDSLKEANNILITVKSSPSLDQLAACIALTLMVNELDKHGTAVFSGQVPSVLEFLQPEKTIEKTTDSLRDFIISLDKAKADKLRYKVEDTVVKVFITPYRTSLSANDLEFSQGDFNVDVVVALGVHHQDDLDEAITAHGRILHDATVISINTDSAGSDDLGSINWVDSSVSSLSEMVATIAGLLGKDNLIDNQVATALLTGIVTETERFGNAKTTPATMEVAALLLTAGANQELVATKLAEPVKSPVVAMVEEYKFPGDDQADSDEDNQTGSGGDSGNGGNGGLPVPVSPEPPKPTNPGELSIEHTDDPIQLVQPSQPAWQATEVIAAPKYGLDQFTVPAITTPLEPQGQVPPVYRPAQADANQTQTPTLMPPRLPQLPQPPLPIEVTPRSDDDADLDYLKGRQVTMNTGARIEPLHDPADSFPTNTPKLSPAVSDNDGKVAASNSDDLDANKFALAPPTMGGTLTANLPNERHIVDPTPIDSIADKSVIDQPPILKHDRPMFTMPEPEQQAAPVEQSKPAELTALLDAAPFDARLSETSNQNAALEQSPVPTGPAPRLEAAPADQSNQADQCEHEQTLSDIEKEVHSPHDPSADTSYETHVSPALQAGLLDASQPPQGAADMPLPTTVSLPAPQIVAPDPHQTGSMQTAPPPVPPPLISPLAVQ